MIFRILFNLKFIANHPNTIYSNQNYCFRFEYELVVVPGLVLNDSVAPVIKKRVKEAPVLINIQDLGGDVAAGKTFTMGIRMRTQKVSEMR